MQTEILSKLQESIQELFRKHIEGNDVRYEQEEVISDIHSLTENKEADTVVVIFEDEYMAYAIAGHISGRIYDAMEADLASLGYEITDTDGTIMHLTSIK